MNVRTANEQTAMWLILTKVCNTTTTTIKGKRLANTNIEISQHALVTFKVLTEFVDFHL